MSGRTPLDRLHPLQAAPSPEACLSPCLLLRALELVTLVLGLRSHLSVFGIRARRSSEDPLERFPLEAVAGMNMPSCSYRQGLPMLSVYNTTTGSAPISRAGKSRHRKTWGESRGSKRQSQDSNPALLISELRHMAALLSCPTNALA